MNDVAGIYTHELPPLDRYVQLGIAQGRVISVDFPQEPESDATEAHELLDRIEAYFGGTEDNFEDVTIALTLPTDQQAVLEQVQMVPYGETIRVERLTRMVAGLDPDEEADQRTVRDALTVNPAALLIPDHRIRDGPSAAPADVAAAMRAVEGL
jgi:methylated-DNA-[protein]-cysteine S-methyltransferase